jgi:hypothetical protein
MVVQIVIGIIKIYVFSTSGFTGFDVVRIAPETTLSRAVIIVPSATCATLPFKVPSLRVVCDNEYSI